MYGRAAAQRTSPPARVKQHQVYRECVVTYRRCLSDAAAQQHITIAYIYYVYIWC